MPAFREPAFLLNFARDLLSFWALSAKPASGGLFHCLRDDGHVYDARTRHLVSSTRLVVQFAWAITHDVPLLPAPAPSWRELLDSCLLFLRERHFVAATGGYRWIVNVDGDDAEGARAAPSEPGDDSNRSYGLCFVLLAYSAAHAAGVAGMRARIDDVTETLTARFWEAAHGLYADEASPDWSATDPYRGQNANMHAVEAHMAAFAATRDALHLHRARTIAHAMCVRQAALVDAATRCGPLVYEHYAEDWSAPDLAYNRDKPDDRFRPYGFQPGHLFEWAKLLVQLDALGVEDADGLPAAWRLPTARRFFDAALRGWDARGGGGFVYSMAPTPALPVCNGLKYKWVQAEAAAAAALLAHAPGVDADARRFYLAWYDIIMHHFWAHFVDHTHGSIYCVLSADLAAVDDFKCPPGKVDYHATGLCYDAAAAFSAALPPCAR
jgi:mannose/cellobiose epimerase-like protein (N-acyl-D-glucosamine 2-epimerase family)